MLSFFRLNYDVATRPKLDNILTTPLGCSDAPSHGPHEAWVPAGHPGRAAGALKMASFMEGRLAVLGYGLMLGPARGLPCLIGEILTSLRWQLPTSALVVEQAGFEQVVVTHAAF